jgi:hypothetical protein
MTLLEDLERNAEEKETPDMGVLKTVLSTALPEIPELPDGTDPEMDPHPGSTRNPGQLVFLSEAFLA